MIKLLSFETILTIIRMFDIKHFMNLLNIYLSLLESFILIITCFLKIFVYPYYILKYFLILMIFTQLLIIRMMKLFMHINVIGLLRLFTTLIITLLRSYLIMIVQLRQLGQSFQLLINLLPAVHLTMALTLF